MDIKKYIQNSIDTKIKILNDCNILSTLSKIAEEIVNAYKRGNKVLTAGNGGSAGDAQHIVCELVSRFYFARQALTALSLSTDTSVLTAVGNDYGFEELFSRQIEANAKKGDVFIGISTSGNSKNIITALKKAKEKEVITVGLTGLKKCEMDKYCDYIIHVPSSSTPTIQESHIMTGHIICAMVEEAIFAKTGEDK